MFKLCKLTINPVEENRKNNFLEQTSKKYANLTRKQNNLLKISNWQDIQVNN